MRNLVNRYPEFRRFVVMRASLRRAYYQKIIEELQNTIELRLKMRNRDKPEEEQEQEQEQEH